MPNAASLRVLSRHIEADRAMSASAWLQSDGAIIPVQGESLFHSFQSAATLLASVSDNTIVVVGLANQKN